MQDANTECTAHMFWAAVPGTHALTQNELQAKFPKRASYFSHKAHHEHHTSKFQTVTS